MANNPFNPQPDEPQNQQSMTPGFNPQTEVATLDACPCDVTPITATGVDSTHIRVTFARPVLDNAAIRCVDVWEVTPPGSEHAVDVFEVVPEGDPVESVLLTTSEHRTVADYICSLHFLEAA